MIDLKKFIRDIPDFPKAGILFRDITPLLKNPTAFNHTIESLVDASKDLKPDAIIGIESRGFIFGSPLAIRLELPFVPVRKPGKLPAKRLQIEYSLEYGSSQLDIHQDALIKGDKVIIVDDLLATGGTARATAKLVEMLGAEVLGMFFVIELGALKGREKLGEYSVTSLVKY